MAECICVLSKLVRNRVQLPFTMGFPIFDIDNTNELKYDEFYKKLTDQFKSD